MTIVKHCQKKRLRSSHCLFSMLFSMVVFLTLVSCNSCSSSDPDEITLTQDQESALFVARNPEEGVKHLDSLAPELQGEGWVLYLRGMLALKQAEKDSSTKDSPHLATAEAFFKKAGEASYSDYLVKVRLAKIVMLRGDMISSIKTLEALCKDEPEKGEAFFEVGKIYQDFGEIESATNNIGRAHKLEKDRADIKVVYGDFIFNNLHNREVGSEMMRRAMNLDSELPICKELMTKNMFKLAEEKFNDKKIDYALNLLEEVFKTDPDHLKALKLKGRILDQTQEIGQTLDVFRRCYELAPDDLDSKQCFSRALIRKGYQSLFLKKRDEAFAFFQEAIDLKAPEVDTTTVAQLIAQNKESNMVKEQKEELVSNLRDGRALFEKGAATLKAGHAQSSLDMFKQSLKLLPDNPYAHMQMGIAYNQLGNVKEAEKELIFAIDQGDKMEIKLPEAHLKLAEIAIRSEQYDKGEERLNRYFKIFPEMANDPLAKSLKRLLMLKD